MQCSLFLKCPDLFLFLDKKLQYPVTANVFTNNAQRNWIQYALSYSYWISVMSLPIIQQFYLKKNTKWRRSWRSQWPRSLRRGSAPARFLGLWVRIPMGHKCLSVVSVVCCQVEVSATGRSLVERSPTECVCVCVCVQAYCVWSDATVTLYTCNEWAEEVRQRKKEQLLLKMFVCDCVGRNRYLVTM